MHALNQLLKIEPTVPCVSHSLHCLLVATALNSTMAGFIHFIDTHRGGKAMLYERISALFEWFQEGQYSLSDFLEAIQYQTGH